MKHIQCGVIASVVTGFFLTSGTPQSAQAQRSQGENKLLGIKLLSKFSDVLKAFGPPTEIQVGQPYITDQATEGTGLGSAGTGAGNSLPGFGSGGRQGGPPAGYGAPSGGGYQPGGRQGGPPAGYGGPGGGGGRQGGPPGGGGASGSGDGGPVSEANEQGEYTEGTWWYHLKKKDKYGHIVSTVHYAFMFNKEGRVIQISQYGYSSPFRTAKGVGLSSQLGDVMKAYGFGIDGERTGDNLFMRYAVPKDNILSKLGFQMSKNRVIGITIAVNDPKAPQPSSQKSASAGGGGRPGGPGGRQGGSSGKGGAAGAGSD